LGVTFSFFWEEIRSTMKKLSNGLIGSIFLYSGLLFAEGINVDADRQPISALRDSSVAAVEAVPTQTQLPTMGAENTTPTKEQQELYFRELGYFIAHSAGIANLGLNGEESEQVVRGVRAAINGEESSWTHLDELGKAQEFFLQREREKIENTKKLAELFLKTKDGDSGIQRTASGLRHRIIKEGDATRADEDCTVEMDWE
jgi:hypothetical protein